MARRASPDYEQPAKNVADEPDPVQLPATKARASVPVAGMRYVLFVGIGLVVIAFAIIYFSWVAVV